MKKLLLTLAIVMFFSTTTHAQDIKVTMTTTYEWDKAYQVLDDLNAYRKSLGLNEVETNQVFMREAMYNTAWARISNGAHITPWGDTAHTIVNHYGLDAIDAWKESPGHNAHMKKSKYTHCGIGFTEDGCVAIRFFVCDATMYDNNKYATEEQKQQSKAYLSYPTERLTGSETVTMTAICDSNYTVPFEYIGSWDYGLDYLSGKLNSDGSWTITPKAQDDDEDEEEQEQKTKKSNNTPELVKVTSKKGRKLNVQFKAKTLGNYEVQISTSKKFKKNNKTIKAGGTHKAMTMKKSTKLAKKYSNKKVYVRVRYELDGKTSKWSNVKSVKIKK